MAATKQVRRPTARPPQGAAAIETADLRMAAAGIACRQHPHRSENLAAPAGVRQRLAADPQAAAQILQQGQRRRPSERSQPTRRRQSRRALRAVPPLLPPPARRPRPWDRRVAVQRGQRCSVTACSTTAWTRPSPATNAMPRTHPQQLTPCRPPNQPAQSSWAHIQDSISQYSAARITLN